MAKTAPVSFSSSGSKTNAATDPTELMIEHQIAPEQTEPEDNTTMAEGGDSGTKGTGSAGRT